MTAKEVPDPVIPSVRVGAPFLSHGRTSGDDLFSKTGTSVDSAGPLP